MFHVVSSVCWFTMRSCLVLAGLGASNSAGVCDAGSCSEALAGVFPPEVKHLIIDIGVDNDPLPPPRNASWAVLAIEPNLAAVEKLRQLRHVQAKNWFPAFSLPSSCHRKIGILFELSSSTRIITFET